MRKPLTLEPRARGRAFVNGLQPGFEPDKMNRLLDSLEDDERIQKHRG